MLVSDSEESYSLQSPIGRLVMSAYLTESSSKVMDKHLVCKVIILIVFQVQSLPRLETCNTLTFLQAQAQLFTVLILLVTMSSLVLIWCAHTLQFLIQIVLGGPWNSLILCITKILQTLTTLKIRTKFIDRKSTRLNSSHLGISYAVFCLKKTRSNVSRLAERAHESSGSTR